MPLMCYKCTRQSTSQTCLDWFKLKDQAALDLDKRKEDEKKLVKAVWGLGILLGVVSLIALVLGFCWCKER